jgi:Chitobiase/beta-hexosaminidase C-terminal domain/Abnormal spindle-like microcephaly-assoc'd, ASPM-SPD-2-Hydin
MRPRSFCGFGTCTILFLLLLFSVLSMLAPLVSAQTTQPFLFAATYDNNTKSSGFVTILRNSSTGALSLVPNTAVSFKDPCSPSTIDPTGHFLFAVCGEGVAMFTLDSTTGIVSETATSPYAASVSTGQSGILVATESTGQYVYLLKVGATQSPIPSTFTLDTFQIDSNTPSLVPINSQSLPFNATFVDSAADPAHHGIFVFVNQEQGGAAPAALLFSISFDLATGVAAVPSAGLPIGENARSLAISPSGGYLALGWGDAVGSLTVYQLSPANLGMALVGSVSLGMEDGTYGNYTFPDSLFFSPGGNLLYVQAPPANFPGGIGLPFLVFDPASVAQLPTSPISLANANFLNGLADPQAPFTYVSNSGPTNYGISVYQVDLSSGLPSQPAHISSPFFPQINLTPLFTSIEQGRQGIQSPTLGASPGDITFDATVAGKSSAPRNVVLKSLGSQSVSLSSIQISGANAADFSETDNCISSPVLPTNHTCTIAVTYSPTSVGTSQAILFITDNAAGSPQSISLSGTAVEPPPTSPAVTLSPASALNFPGTSTQGTSGNPQNVTLTNSGDAPLQILSAVLSSFNSSDFSITSDTCSGSIASKASCTISLVFSPQASGVRSTTLTITDNAANSPQSITLNGTAVPAVTIASIGGTTTATLSAGQTAQFNLQAVPGAGFNGTLSFSCSGAPFGATCTVPASLSVSNGSTVPFAVSISTLGASQVAPFFPIPTSPTLPTPPWISVFLLAAIFAVFLQSRSGRNPFPRTANMAASMALSLLLIVSGVGCGGGAGPVTTSKTPLEPVLSAPSIQPGAGIYTSAQSVSIADSTSGATIYYTTDGSAPTSASQVYSGPFSLNSPTTIQAMATATGYSNSAVTTAAFKFRTPPATYPITVTVTATAAGSSKILQLNPIVLTMIVN